MRIAVLGLGHIGLANAVSLAQIYDVIGYDIDTNKIADLRKGVLPFEKFGVFISCKYFCSKFFKRN